MDGYMEILIPRYLPEKIKRHFRISRKTFECIMLHLEKNFNTTKRQQTGGRLQRILENDLMMLRW